VSFMKKVFLIISLVLLLSVLCSCGAQNADTTTTQPPTTEAPQDVKIEFERALIADSVITSMEGYGAETTFSEDEKIVTFTFSPEEHEKMLKDKYDEVVAHFNEVQESEDTYIEKIEFIEDFRELKVFVNRESYLLGEDHGAYIEFNVAGYALHYQQFLGQGQKTFVKVLYSDNEEEITSYNRPIEQSFE